jgi:hypothetical protein
MSKKKLTKAERDANRSLADLNKVLTKVAKVPSLPKHLARPTLAETEAEIFAELKRVSATPRKKVKPANGGKWRTVARTELSGRVSDKPTMVTVELFFQEVYGNVFYRGYDKQGRPNRFKLHGDWFKHVRCVHDMRTGNGAGTYSLPLPLAVSANVPLEWPAGDGWKVPTEKRGRRAA